jgi:hypothetical protein
VVKILPFLLRNKNFLQKKVSPMNPVVAPHVGQPESNKVAVTVAVIVANNAKCSPPSVPHVEKKQLCLSNLRATDQYIAAIATNRANAATGKTAETFLGKS